jgi:hypothetical protein
MVFIPEGAGRCQGVAGLRFRVRALFAGRAELTPWLLFPRRCRFRASGLAGSGTGPAARPRSGAGDVLDAGAREPMIEAPGKAHLAAGAVYAVIGAPSPAVRLAGLLAAFIPSGVPRPGGPGGMGRFASRDGRGQSHFRCRRPGWYRVRRGAQDLAAARPSGPAAHAAELVARRRCPSRML